MNRNTPVVLVAGLGPARRLLLTAALESHGYQTLEARDGFGALQIAIGSEADVLVTEDEMPGLTGRELIGVVRKHRAIGHCLLISDVSDQTASGYTEFMDGKTSFLVAPFRQLLDRIREVAPPLSLLLASGLLHIS